MGRAIATSATAGSERTSAMRTTLRRSVVHLCACLALAATAGNGRAGFISGGGGLEGLGTFTGHVDYTAADAGHSTLTITLWNTSPPANGGFPTPVAFPHPLGLI